ncbi:hypothetical protein [uncultured Tateyamaria sp.]|uniref:hypothetical protein n=1 Tax=uncultured Tateyamaria sp. TaxID=455651 RepID=UPI00260624A5|nr:hypothetical protein [uncultured Tateyamaria sp.]
MVPSHLFQDFGTAQPAKDVGEKANLEEIEDLKLESFEAGYQAGWEDAVKAQSDTLTHVSSGLAASLQAASFDYHELRATLNTSVQTIMEQVVSIILPQMAHASLGTHVRDQIVGTTREALDRPIEVVVAPEAKDPIQGVLADQLPEPFTLITDPLMASTQVVVRLGQRETEINLDKVTSDIRAAIDAFFDTQSPEERNGGST